MEQTIEINTEMSPVTKATVSLGQTLRKARELQGLSISDVSGQIKFAPRKIEALEADDFNNLPEMAFVRGFVRSYAKLLQLDAQQLLDLLPDQDASIDIPEPVQVLNPGVYTFQRQNLIWLGAAVLLGVLAVGFAMWHLKPDPATNEVSREVAHVQPNSTQITNPDDHPAASTTAASSVTAVAQLAVAPTPVVAMPMPIKVVPPPVTPIPPVVMTTPTKIVAQEIKVTVQPVPTSQAASLRMVFEGDSWVEVRDKQGKILSQQLNVRGSILQLSGNAPFALTIGRAASVKLYFRDKPVDLTTYTQNSRSVARLKLE
jgi:cytoskeleton protein RodZ